MSKSKNIIIINTRKQLGDTKLETTKYHSTKFEIHTQITPLKWK